MQVCYDLNNELNAFLILWPSSKSYLCYDDDLQMIFLVLKNMFLMFKLYVIKTYNFMISVHFYWKYRLNRICDSYRIYNKNLYCDY